MTRHGTIRRMRRQLVGPGVTAVGLTALVLTSCAGPAQQSTASASARAACREHADNVFEQQNRNAVYRSDTYSTDLRDSPFGSSGMPGAPTFGLSQQFGLQTTMQNCINGTGDQPATTEENAAAQPPVASNSSATKRPTAK